MLHLGRLRYPTKFVTQSEDRETTSQSITSSIEPELVDERKELLKKLGEATGEIQLSIDSFDSLGKTELSSFDFKQPTSFESNFAYSYSSLLKENGLEESEITKIQCDCGHEIDSNFSFCISCGKNFADS